LQQRRQETNPNDLVLKPDPDRVLKTKSQSQGVDQGLEVVGNLEKRAAVLQGLTQDAGNGVHDQGNEDHLRIQVALREKDAEIEDIQTHLDAELEVGAAEDHSQDAAVLSTTLKEPNRLLEVSLAWTQWRGQGIDRRRWNTQLWVVIQCTSLRK